MAVAKPAPVGSKVIDSLPLSQGATPAQVAALKAEGVDGVAVYLGVANKVLVDVLLAAGLFVFGVTLGCRYDGKAAVAQAKALGLPPGTTLFLDVEGKSAYDDGTAVIAKINAWANDVAAAGFVPGIYVAPPQPLTSDELWNLRVSRYWKGGGSIRDRNGALAEPTGCGWCMTQMWPSQTVGAGTSGAVLVDFDMVGCDFRSRVPTVAYA